MPVRESYAQAAMCDYFGEREVWRFNVEVALDNLQVGRDTAEKLVRFTVGDVA